MIGADFNGHVSEGNIGDEEVMGRLDVQESNLEGQMVADFFQNNQKAVMNTFFQNREHKVT